MISALRADAFTEPGGPASALSIRKAGMRDIAPILDLINGYAARGIMLPRTEFEMSEAIRDFSICEAESATPENRLMGCGALHFYTPQIAEIRSLAVREEAKSMGVGRKLVEQLVEEAREYELDAVFAFTDVAEFFQKVGFHVVERGVLPLKAWKDCLRCPKFEACDEIAVLRILRPEHWPDGASTPRGYTAPSNDDQLIQLPKPKKL